jgi:hypothetical protein
MLSPWPSSLLPIMALGLVVFLAATRVFAMVLLRKFEFLRGLSERRLDELSSRLRLVESRIDQFHSGAAPSGSARDELLAPAPAGLARNGGPSSPRLRHFEPSEKRVGPPLIAIPDLASQGDEPDPQAETELVKRHAEVWPLAASGMPPAEISRQTGQPIGEVELIVGLYRRLHSSEGRIDHARSD